MSIIRTKSFKPLNIPVTTGSLMVVPPTGQYIGDNDFTVLDFEASTTYAYGDIIRSTSNGYYFVIVAGDTGLTEPTHTDGDAVNGTATLRAVRWARQVLSITNTSTGTVVVSLSRGTAAEAGKGIVLTSYGTLSEGFSGPAPYDGPWYAIGSGAGTLAISEG